MGKIWLYMIILCEDVRVIYIIIGSLPTSLCMNSVLHDMDIDDNTGLSCASLCLSTVTITSTNLPYCRTNQEIAICSIVAAANVNTIGWGCNSFGFPIGSVCSSFTGVTCVDDVVVSIVITGYGIIG